MRNEAVFSIDFSKVIGFWIGSAYFPVNEKKAAPRQVEHMGELYVEIDARSIDELADARANAGMVPLSVHRFPFSAITGVTYWVE